MSPAPTRARHAARLAALRGVALRRGAASPFGHGSTEAYDEAAYLLLHALHLPLDRLEPFLDARLTQAERAEASAQLFARRIDERVPAAYLTHEAWLGEFRFYVDERVIIPRSFIAELLPGGAGAVRRAGPRRGLRARHVHRVGMPCHPARARVPGRRRRRRRHLVGRARRRAAQRRDYGLAARINLIRSDLFAEPAGEELRPHHQQSAVRRLRWRWTTLPRGVPARARAWRWRAATTASMRCARCSRRRRASSTMAARLVVEVGHNRAAVEAAFPRLPMTWLSD